MTPPTRIRRTLGAAAALVATGALVAACGSSTPQRHSTAAAASSAAHATPASDRTVEISTIAVHDGRFLTGAKGRALYLWDGDRHDVSNCHGACAQAWPPLLSSSRPVAGADVKASALGTIARAGGGRQVTYDGHPLYYFTGDPRAGTTNGEGSSAFGAKWWLVSPGGSALSAGSHAAGKTTSSSGSSW